MSYLIIPECALESSDAFKDWFTKTHAQLFGHSLLSKGPRHKFPENDPAEAKKLVDHVIVKVNLVMFGAPVYPYTKPKNRKFACNITDVMSITAYIMLEQFDVKLVTLSKVLGVHHATTIYYRKKVDARFFTEKKKFVEKYSAILMLLINDGTLKTIKTPKSEVEDYIRSRKSLLEELS